MSLRWGIIATGRIAATFADAAAESDRNQLRAVAGRSLDSAKAFVERYPALELHAHAGYAALLSDPEVDAIYIATPHTSHAEWAIRALQAGKHVLVEKPLGLDHAQTMAIVDAATVSGRFLMEAFMYRCHPQTHRLLQLIADGAIGEVRHIDASFGYHSRFDPRSRLFANELAGGAILDVGCYPISMARAIMGSEPTGLTAHGRLGTTGVDEWTAALLQFEGGASAQVAAAISLDLDNSVTVHGSTGQIHLANPWLCADAAGRWRFELRRQGKVEEIHGSADPLYRLEIDHVAEQLASNALSSPHMNWEDSRNNALCLDSWRRAIGLEYRCEQPATHTGPILGKLARPARPLPTGTVQHLSKPVSRLVMGCDNQPGMSHAAIMWDHFIELGGNCFDTAHIYGGGLMEQLLGHWHRQRGLREELVIIGKGAHTPDNFPDRVSPQLDSSLERLQTDYVDLYFLHRDNLEVPVGEFVDVLNEEVARGRIRAFGGSNWTLARIRAANEYASRSGQQGFSAVSNNFSLAEMVNPLWPGVESATDPEFRRYLLEAGLALMPWSSQARGFFTPWADSVISHAGTERRVITNMQPSVAELRHTWFSESNLARRQRAGMLAEQRGVPMIEIALAYVAAQPFECFPLIGPRELAETRSCVHALNVTLSPTELSWLEAGD